MADLSKRETNYDLLRVFALLAIMSVHVSSVWIDGFSAIVREGGAVESLTHPLVACLWDCLPRFGVPCFFRRDLCGHAAAVDAVFKNPRPSARQTSFQSKNERLTFLPLEQDHAADRYQ